MARPSWLTKMYWSYFGKPVRDRALFQVLLNHSLSSVLEIGVGNGNRMRRIAQLSQPTTGCETLRYIGTDEFESASDKRSHLTLKQAHQLASGLGLKASLIPGDAAGAVPRVAHKFGVSDLIIIDGGIDLNQPADGPVGSWLDRLAHQRSIILASSELGGELVRVNTSRLSLTVRSAA